MIELPGLWSLTPLGALLGVLVLFYWLTASGRLIPKSSHERELAAANHRGDEWKATALEYRSVLDRKEQQVSTLIESGAVIQDVLREASPRPGTTEPSGGG